MSTPTDKLTDKQAEFVRYFVGEGQCQTEAARSAGYEYPRQAAYDLLQKPHIVRAVHSARERLFQGEIGTLAARRLRDWIRDDAQWQATPAAAKVGVLKLSMDLAKHGGPAAEVGGDKALEDMSTDELREFIRVETAKLEAEAGAGSESVH